MATKKASTRTVAKKGSCGETPRVGKKGDPKPLRGGGRRSRR